MQYVFLNGQKKEPPDGQDTTNTLYKELKQENEADRLSLRTMSSLAIAIVQVPPKQSTADCALPKGNRRGNSKVAHWAS